MLLGDFFHRGRKHAARAAPIGPEIHHHRLRLAGFDYVGLKVRVANCLNVVCHVFLMSLAGMDDLSSIIRCACQPRDSGAFRSLIQRGIRSGRSLPGKILRHPVHLQRPPSVLIPQSQQRRMQALEKRSTIVRLKLEPEFPALSPGRTSARCRPGRR